MRKQLLFMLTALLTMVTQGAWATGELTGLFSVSETKKVRFSQGNLQYTKSTGVWSFMEHQYSTVETNGSPYCTDNYGNKDVVSLFSWATSGYNHGATSYQPYSTNPNNENYYAYGNASYNLYDQTGQADWGYNAISNGGNTENSGWRTLTTAEWQYLFANHTKGWSTVNGVNGYVIRPDGVSTAIAASYTASDWATEEAAGAVFLPAAGYRNSYLGTYVYDKGSKGRYWSSSCDGSSNACDLYISSSLLGTNYSMNRNYGESVRLVKDAMATITTVPTVIPGLTYTGSAQTLITAGVASGGTMYYSLDGSSWNTSLPSGTDWGTYTVYYKVVGDATHADNLGGMLTAIIGKAASDGTTIGPWTLDAQNSGWTGYEGAGTSTSFNGLNHTAWLGSTYRYDDSDGCGYAYLGTTTVNSKYAIYSTYKHTETVPAYTRKTLIWNYQLAGWTSYLSQTTALYAADNLAYLKTLPVDFTEGYTDEDHGSNNFYHLAHLTQQSQWGAATSEQTGWFGFDNRNGSTSADITDALLLTQVMGDGTGVSNFVHNWGGIKHVSSSWETYYYKHITFNANGGEGNMSVQEIENSGTLTANVFTRAGYSFAGWATTENGDVVYADGAEITATSEDKGLVTLYAKWTENTATLVESVNNATWISDHAGEVYDITLTRTLQTGRWNTFSVPFSMANPSGWTVKELTNASIEGTTLTLTFGTAASIVAGHAYLVQVGDANVVNPTFNDVEIVDGTTPTTIAGVVSFVPVINPTAITANDKTVLFVTSAGALTWPSSNGTIKAFRAYFQLANAMSASEFVLDFGGGEQTTGIIGVTNTNRTNDTNVYDLQGRRLGSTLKKGLYIYNGRKVVIK